MNRQLCYISVLLALLAGLAQTARATVGFTVTPSAASNTYSGDITLQITGLTNGETVVVQKFLDLNADGVIDSGDWLVRQFNLTDGEPGMVIGGVTNINVPGDLNAASGDVTAALNFQNGDFVQNIIGSYLYRLSSPAGHFTPLTSQFVVTNFPFAQRITGTVVSNNTSTTLPDAVVVLFSPAGNNGPGQPLAGAVADNAGNYLIQMPPGTYKPMVVRSNYLYNYAVSPLLTLGTHETVTTNLTLTNATATISGRVVDADHATIDLPGICLYAANGAQKPIGLIAFACADANGNFNMRVGGGTWGVGTDYSFLAVHGYVGWYHDPVNHVNAGATNVSVVFPKATALFYGKVEDGLGHPVPGIAVSASDNNEQYYMLGYSDTNGDYVVGALGRMTNDPWRVSISSDSSPTNYLFSYSPIGSTNLSAGEAVRADFTAILATNHISGWLKDDYGNPITGVEIYAGTQINGTYWEQTMESDSSGNYWLNVPNGAWDVGVAPAWWGDNTSLPGKYQQPADRSVTISNDNAVVNFVAPLVTNSGPTLQFTASPTNGEMPLLVQFSAASLDSSGHSIVSWNWNFGDGATSSSPDPSHTYTDAGVFIPTLVATNDNGLAVIGNGSPIVVSTPFTYTNNNGAITITGYTGSGGSVSIPSTINGYPVTTIGTNAFYNQTTLLGVTIPDSVTSIGNGAFLECSGLTSVTIPNGVTSIGGDAFYGCSGLTNLILGNGVTNIGSYAFYGCYALTSFTVPASLAGVGDYAFAACFSLTSVFFLGNAPSGNPNVVSGDIGIVFYCLPGASGWNLPDGPPAVLWNPTPQTTSPSFGVRTNRFGFNIVGTTNIPIVVEAATNLMGAPWMPLFNGALTNGSIYVSDAQWTNYSGRFYRIRSP